MAWLRGNVVYGVYKKTVQEIATVFLYFYATMVHRKKQEQQGEGNKTNLKQLRERLEMTQFELAGAIGMSLTAIASCEQGKSELKLSPGAARKLHLLMMSKLGYGIERLPDSLKAISQEGIFV